MAELQSNNQPRPGRDNLFNIDIHTEDRRCFQFDVPAMNHFDAYFQLTKRMAYRVIPDISKVTVFEGTLRDRTNSIDPLLSFQKNELVYIPDS